ncbi:MAG: M48 family metallopeptidase [Candidatus Omnitrophica bacterium]|nr:M48 family metallopeptidase [Candidatus Omnitrophota bacterium]
METKSFSEQNLHFNGFPFHLIRSLRRTLELRVTEEGVFVRAPKMMPEARIFKFIQEKSSWIDRASARLRFRRSVLEKKSYEDKETFFVQGQARTLHINREAGKSGWPRLIPLDNGWQVNLRTGMPEPPEFYVRQMLVRWYQRLAADVLPRNVRMRAEVIGVPTPKVVVKTHKRLWGSCNYRTHILNLNWQLMAFPQKVIDYVIIHELCHLRHANHSKCFWAEVEKYCPSYRQERLWLKAQSHQYILP